jgi:hypothetical protein
VKRNNCLNGLLPPLKAMQVTGLQSDGILHTEDISVCTFGSILNLPVVSFDGSAACFPVLRNYPPAMQLIKSWQKSGGPSSISQPTER